MKAARLMELSSSLRLEAESESRTVFLPAAADRMCQLVDTLQRYVWAFPLSLVDT